ncbi:hypothetical protein CC2G_014029 [Coprinopsis cinerea AmutBmut pab1-1]|nr:hypothetical protein CC2G_014029 [Coprinopsis cinerea AmutBmut pab1-1]
MLTGAEDKLETYIIVSRQIVPGEKPVDDIVLIPSISRALVQSDRQIHFYTLPNLEPDPIKPIRNVMTFAVDDQHLRRPAPKSNPALGYSTHVDPVEFCVVKRSGIAMFSLRERLFYSREIPLPQSQGAGSVLAKRAGKYLCFADKENYNMVDLEDAQLFPLLPISQAPSQDGAKIRPMINVISENEFLILSWTGASTLGLFITGDGDPVRGTLEWPSYPLGICLDYPHVTSLLPNGTVEVHSVDTQAQLQVIPPPPSSSRPTSPAVRLPSSPSSIPSPRHQNIASSLSQRLAMIASVGGYQVPSLQRSECMRKVPFKLLRTPC